MSRFNDDITSIYNQLISKRIFSLNYVIIDQYRRFVWERLVCGGYIVYWCDGCLKCVRIEPVRTTAVQQKGKLLDLIEQYLMNISKIYNLFPIECLTHNIIALPR